MARQARRQAADISFGSRLILFRYFLHLFGKETLAGLAGPLNHTDYEGLTDSQNTRFFEYLDRQAFLHPDDVKISRDQLRQYDENICRYVKQIGQKRGGLTLKYFQYVALLFTEMYLDRYFSDAEAFAAELNEYRKACELETMGLLEVTPFTPQSMNKLAFMCATGSGKTLIMHINILQFLHYQRRALRNGRHMEINKIIVLAPNEGMSNQHLEELALSSIKADLFMKDMGFLTQSRDTVIVIDMNKLKEEGKKKTVSVDSFEQNNLVLVDEAHRGLSGDVWYDYRNRLSQDGGFAFEYSATFKQALRSAKSTDKKAQAMLDEYGKSIIMDYSYKFFFEDGYGKDYRIYNLRETMDTEQKLLYLTGCLLSFYQQVKLHLTHSQEYAPFQIEKPLLVFVGNRVTAQTSKEELTDVEEVLTFLDGFVRNKTKTVGRIQSVLDEDTGLIDAYGHELFYSDFLPLKNIFGHTINAEDVYTDMMHIVFNADAISDEPRLHVENLRQADGEIGLKIGEHGSYFGVINIGDPAALIKNCEQKDIVCKTEEFSAGSLFRSLNQPDSDIRILIGSRKFTEGWNSWRVSTMGLINFAKGEGSQAIQLFGRGVRLHGYGGCLKRSGKLDMSVTVPQDIQSLETLTIFGIKAQYMEDFKQYLELEDMPVEKAIQYKLPVISRADQLKGKKLATIRLPQGVSFKKHAQRLVLHAPTDDDGLLGYLVKNRSVVDCRSKVQTIESGFSWHLESTTQEYTLPSQALPFLDYQRIFEDLEQYKNEKTLYNLSLNKECLQNILAADGWYSLIIPGAHIAFDSMEKLPLFTDFATSVLKLYIDKFCKYYREQWEAPRMTYQTLDASDNNFVSEYSFSYLPTTGDDPYSSELEHFISDVKALLEAEGGLRQEKSAAHSTVIAFDFRGHLYAPLICINGHGLTISVSPVSLNKGEKQFVDYLREYCETYPATIAGADLFLLRNKSKVGMGFFEAGNFYPDYVLWIDFPDRQLVSFIDPKGLLRIMPDNPKIDFYRKIKELQERLQPSMPEKKVILNSFIMSDTPSADLAHWWQMDKQTREAHHVMNLDNRDCVEVMMQMILQDSAM